MKTKEQARPRAGEGADERGNENGVEQVEADPERLQRARWHEYAIRFVFGGLITAMTGYIANRYGPVIGGLFLAFPAILPASATLVERHSGKEKARDNTGGATFGAVGLLAFGAAVWLLSERLAPPLVLFTAFAAWLTVGIGLWYLWQRTRA